MPEYQLGQPHYLDNRYRAKGERVSWDGAPSMSMIPIDKAAKERKAEYDAKRPKRGPGAGRPSGGVGWTPAIETGFGKALAPAADIDEAAPLDGPAMRKKGGKRRAAAVASED